MYNNCQGHNHSRDDSIKDDGDEEDDDDGYVNHNYIDDYFKCMHKVYSIFKIFNE